jgi:hypothetical protein
LWKPFQGASQQVVSQVKVLAGFILEKQDKVGRSGKKNPFPDPC